MIRHFGEYVPQLATNAFVAESADVIGQVEIGEQSSIWYGAVLRGDVDGIYVGARTSIQDNCTVHVDAGRPTRIGNDVTIGHNAVVHAATIEDGCLIGMGAIVLDGAVIGHGSVIGAGAVVTPGTVIPPLSQAMGIPAKVVKQFGEEKEQELRQHAQGYVALAQTFRQEQK